MAVISCRENAHNISKVHLICFAYFLFTNGEGSRIKIAISMKIVI